MICDEAAKNIDWQFTNNLMADKPDLSPFSALSMFTGSWAFNSANGTVAVKDSRLNNVQRVMDSLKAGQRHNPGAMASYDHCLSACGSIFDFMIVVVSAASGTASNLGEARINVNWQKQNNPQSLADARTWWSHSLATIDHDAVQYSRTTAVMQLMWGQRHNAHVMSLYRACFRDDANGLFALW